MMFFILPYKVNAVTYQETNQSTFQYNINNFKLEGDYIIINGWGTTDRHQDLTGDDTHEFSLVLTDKSNNESKTYIATLKYADKTRLMRASEAVNHCSGYFNYGVCHYTYTYAGFEFKIPLSDLNSDTEYDIKLRIYEKKVNRGYQESIYVLGIDDSYEKNGLRYQLYSDISKTNVTLTDSSLFVRSGPGQNYSIKSSNKSCSGNGKTLFWYPQGYFSHIIGASQTKPGSVDSELWVNMQYDLGGCVYGKARAVNGTSNNGWAPWVYMLGGSDPAVIKVTSLRTISIDELRAYTAEANTKTKALLTLTSTKNQNITIKAYHNNNLVYNKVHNISGTKSFKIDYTIPNKGTLKVEVIDEHFTQNISSNIYVSSKKEYKLLVENPILVVTDKNRNVTEYKEKIQLSAIPYEIDLSQGRGISGVTSAISYWYPLEEFSLNSDYSVYALYPSQENTMNYEIVDGKVKVNLLKDDVVRSTDHDVSYFYHPNILLSLIQGHLYTDADNEYTYYNGGGIWYPAWNDELGTYDYEYVGTNLGINKITIKRDLVYSITTTMFGVETGKFTIKRVKNPDNPNIIYKRTFTYDELKEYAGD